MRTFPALIAVLFLAWPARAQMIMPVPHPCNLTAIVEKMLTEKYGEQQIGFGVNKRGELTRLFSSGTSFTVVVTRPDGQTCLFDAGDEWNVTDPLKKGTGL